MCHITDSSTGRSQVLELLTTKSELAHHLPLGTGPSCGDKICRIVFRDTDTKFLIASCPITSVCKLGACDHEGDGSEAWKVNQGS